MEVMPAWIQQQESVIGFVELTSMVSELMVVFEGEQSDDWAEEGQSGSDWVSPSTLTRVIRHGSSASLHSVLNQVPDAVSAEFEVIHDNSKVFSWCEYLWPHLRSRELVQERSEQIKIPVKCFYEMMSFHQERSTSWLRRYRSLMNEELSLRDCRIEVDKVGVVAQPDSFQIFKSVGHFSGR
ncbi:hypothetical protein [Granulosicoccus antarcticus]|uniref:Uncharacterized protein n=1 Tax=Granulosicoccus antarcticus IMCC3135 TaxID=1192854 RepID=A0A2Z2NJS9_9GAMM|nr:hypothetical protein [Granulosicoccus antarcticus]ASJ70138.1 hypothetical protein IMCC3135_00035 [Granulosicoccus antarcticus IMCC3135]